VNHILYPLWDSGVKVDHSVRTPAEVRDAASSDIRVISGLLDIRLICGSADLVAEVQSDALDEWRDNSGKRLPEFFLEMESRHERSGELAYLLEPDVKESRGGLRDVTALRLMSASDEIQVPMERVSQAESVLADVREALHLTSGKSKDVLLFQEQDKVADQLGYSDADHLMSEVTKAARAINYLVEQSKYRYFHRRKQGIGTLLKRVKAVSVAEGISVINKEIVFDQELDFDKDPAVGIRAAATAAQLGLPISRDSLERYSAQLRSGKGSLPERWPREARELLISLIGAGESMVDIFEALDQEDAIFSWIPEWHTVRSLPQRNVLHRHTVDRHMVETAVKAAALTRTVHRPDILLFSALFHDIGKGSEEDHSLKGERLIAPIARRIGFSESDIELIQLLVRHHLLLSSTATRRDLDDPATIASVVEHIPDLQCLELLHALSIADGEATGRAAWSDWKATLVADLVARVELAITDNTIAQQPEISEEQVLIASKGELHIQMIDRGSVYALEIIAPDKTGLLSIVSGVLNLLRLDVRSARTKTLGNVAVMEWIVVPDANAPLLTEETLAKELNSAFKSDSKLHERLQARIDAYSQLPKIPVPDPVVETFNDAATDATIIEVRSHDRPALLYRIGDAIAECRVDIRSAIVATLGAEAIDTLYVTEIIGGALSETRSHEVASQLLDALK
jgi:[protein-PII] uridylyltransferase